MFSKYTVMQKVDGNGRLFYTIHPSTHEKAKFILSSCLYSWQLNTSYIQFTQIIAVNDRLHSLTDNSILIYFFYQQQTISKQQELRANRYHTAYSPMNILFDKKY